MKDDLGPLPKVTDDDERVGEADRELNDFLLEWRKRHRLTTAEYVSMVTFAVAHSMKFVIRKERRG